MAAMSSNDNPSEPLILFGVTVAAVNAPAVWGAAPPFAKAEAVTAGGYGRGGIAAAADCRHIDIQHVDHRRREYRWPIGSKLTPTVEPAGVMSRCSMGFSHSSSGIPSTPAADINSDSAPSTARPRIAAST